MKLSTLKEEVKSLPVTSMGDTVIRYHPGRFTRRMQREYQEWLAALAARVQAGEEVAEDETEGDAHWLMKLLYVENPWNLTDDKEKPIKLSVKVLVDDLGYVHMRRIVEAILADLVPNGLTPQPSPRTSEATPLPALAISSSAP